MIKVIPYESWGRDQFPPTEWVKTASTGIRGVDLTSFMKRASHPLALWVQQNPPKPGEVYVHSIAMGSTEKFGMNRNADLYGDHMLRRDTPTFEKHARWFRNHKNTNVDISYGPVRKAIYDTDLGRVELITALNANKEAADRNGGQIAERTLQKMASGIDVAVSMSTKVPGDYCNSCNHFARNRAEYCTPSMCKYGGCRDNLGRVFEDGHHLGVDNRNCVFFDISDVSDTRGADRTAFITGKVADHYTPGGAELAELMGLVTPEYLLDPDKLAQLRCLRKLAEAAAKPHTTAPSWADTIAVRSKLANAQTYYRDPIDDYAAHQTIATLAGDGVMLPPAEWLRLTTRAPMDKCAAALAGGVDPATDLLNRSDLHDVLGGAYQASKSGKYGWLAPTAKALGSEASLGVLKAAFEAPNVINNTPARGELAARYLAYQAAVLAAHENSSNFPLLLADATRHTRVHSA